MNLLDDVLKLKKEFNKLELKGLVHMLGDQIAIQHNVFFENVERILFAELKNYDDIDKDYLFIYGEYKGVEFRTCCFVTDL